MEEFQIRPAVKQDQGTIRRLVNEARINPMGLDWERFWVAETSGEVIGCCQMKPHRDGSSELASLVVQPDWRGQGVARALVDHFLSAQQEKIYLTCRTDLGGFYRAFGFREVAVEDMPRYFRTVYRFINAGKLVGREGLRILVMVFDQSQS
ncbi:MAG: GNAT family N-acetyltransferase [Chloroflexota bacterium]